MIILREHSCSINLRWNCSPWLWRRSTVPGPIASLNRSPVNHVMICIRLLEYMIVGVRGSPTASPFHLPPRYPSVWAQPDVVFISILSSKRAQSWRHAWAIVNNAYIHACMHTPLKHLTDTSVHPNLLVLVMIDIRLSIPRLDQICTIEDHVV